MTQSEGNLAQKVYTATDGGKAGGSTSLFVDLTTNPGQQRFYTGQLEGCTALSVVSQNAMYMAHFWQDKSFIGYDIAVEDEATSTPSHATSTPSHATSTPSTSDSMRNATSFIHAE